MKKDEQNPLVAEEKKITPPLKKDEYNPHRLEKEEEDKSKIETHDPLVDQEKEVVKKAVIDPLVPHGLHGALIPGKDPVYGNNVLGDIERAILLAQKDNQFENAAKMNCILVKLAELQQELKSLKGLDEQTEWLKQLNGLYLIK